MDPMDIDSIVDLPDTRDRPASGNTKGKSSIERGCSDKARIALRADENGSRKVSLRAPRSLRSSISGHGSSKSSAPRNSFAFRRLVDNVFPRYANSDIQFAKSDAMQNTISDVYQDGPAADLTEGYTNNGQKTVSWEPSEGIKAVENGENVQLHSEQGDAMQNTISSVYQDGPTEDLTKVYTNKGKKTVSWGPSGGSKAVENGENLLSAVQLHSEQSVANPLVALGINEGSGSVNRVLSFNHRGKGIESNAIHQPQARNTTSSPNFTSSSRVTGPKRLVRNVCISPCNMSKAQQIVCKDKNGKVDSNGIFKTLPVSSSGLRAGVSARIHVADAQASHVSKGKGIRTYPLPMIDPGGQNANNRDTVNINEIVEEVDDINETFRSFGDLSGWRSTCKEHPLLPVDYGSSSLPVRQRLNLLRSERNQHNGDHPLADVIRDDCLRGNLDDSGIVVLGSSWHTNDSRPTRSRTHNRVETVERVIETDEGRIRSNGPNGDHPLANMIQDDCSRRNLDDSGIVVLGSSRHTNESRPTRSRRHNRVETVEIVIETDEGRIRSSGPNGDHPLADTILDDCSRGNLDDSGIVVRGSSRHTNESRPTRSRRIRSNGLNGASSRSRQDAMARQIEADEILAQELQVQLYNEDLSVRFGERSVLAANSTRPSHVRHVTNISHASSQALASFHSRMDRHRNQIPGRPRPLSSSRRRSSVFPEGMDVHSRMSILEALEAFNNMGVDNSFLETNREFNENDYEMLLALDENNVRRSAASIRRINHLPQSTVQNDNSEEACVVCLETPTTGDVIRHLPCLHKFHKDCIDTWLRRKSCCPICKSSISRLL